MSKKRINTFCTLIALGYRGLRKRKWDADMQHELQGIQAFVKIAEIGCFTKASQFLHISQPALTRRIQKLEESLGTTLFERSTRSVKLTTVGRVFT
jgi:hypothetical protein